MPEPVELHCAFQWDCDACGRENFCRAAVLEVTPDDRDWLMSEYGMTAEQAKTGEWMTRPDEVTCAHCGAEFPVVTFEGPAKPE